MTGASHWLWAEGIPREIPSWNNKRVVLLGKAPFPKKFAPVRVFASLEAKVEVKKKLSSEEVKKMLEEIGQTSSEERDKATAEHKKWRE